ncbi:hypothetical protein VNO78_03154 [Psophocarpus tetragonolobus]|uniref:Uncharacterized protein n=1 Tax=Psophocarpus tetragonolobus TaxID=3891 RepID=A0AAN9SZY7_PSOTE
MPLKQTMIASILSSALSHKIGYSSLSNEPNTGALKKGEIVARDNGAVVDREVDVLDEVSSANGEDSVIGTKVGAMEEDGEASEEADDIAKEKSMVP